MKHEHTPGPWSHGLDSDPPDPGIEAECGGCVAHVQCHGNINTMIRESEEFSHANARLIAASPDLLAACEFAVRTLDMHRDPLANPLAKACDAKRAEDMLRAAVAKAGGVPNHEA